MAFCSGPFMHSFAPRANASFFSQFLGEFWREDECKLSDGEFDVSVQSADRRSSLHGLASPSGCRLNWSIMSLSDGEREQTNKLAFSPPFFPTLAMGPQRNRYKSPLLMRTVNLLLQRERRTDRRRPHMGYGASLASDRENTHRDWTEVA